MSKHNNIAKQYLSWGLSVLITTADKKPALTGWTDLQKTPLTPEEVEQLYNSETIRPHVENSSGEKVGIRLFNASGIGIIAGKVSGGLEIIDVDTKHDTTGSLGEDLKTLIRDNLPELYPSLVIAQTQSGGYHIYYRCSSIEGNKKLASKQNKEVLVETRGEGGYVVAPPSPGYSYIQGDPSNIPTITPSQRDLLFNISQSFNELPEVKPPPKVAYPEAKYNPTRPSPFEDYNDRGDVVALLESNGWRVINHSGNRVNLLRPGETDSKTSGNYHVELRTLRVFSSSTDFNPDIAYNPSQVFSLLECSGDNKLAYRRLLEMGYGEPYTGADIKPTLVKTHQIQVDSVNVVTRVNSVISTPGQALKIENIPTAQGEDIIITSPGTEARAEVLEALELIQTAGKRIYITEGGATPVRDYRYRLGAIFHKYGTLEEEEGGLSDQAQDSLLAEVVSLSIKLQPLDRDVYLKEFLSYKAIQELGITSEALSITVDRLTTTRDKEAQANDLRKLLSEATQLHDTGETETAIELLDDKVKEVKLKDKTTEFSKLLVPIVEAELAQRLSTKPPSLESGYIIDSEPLLLPSGAISVFTAPTSHGKTTFLINMAVNVVQKYPDLEAYFFSYEEDADSILINTLNTYLDTELSANNRRSIRSYFTEGSVEYIKHPVQSKFQTGKEAFFSEFIASRRLNIIYSSYKSDALTDAIRYLSKNAKPGVIFIDYIQLLSLPDGKHKTYSRQEEIKQICLDLKDVAVETGLPIVLGAQFNREVVNHLRIHPTNIGEAGDIERIANLIVGFWNNNFKPMSVKGEIEEICRQGLYQKDTLYTTILKQRGGRTDIHELLEFNGNNAKIKQPRALEDPF